MANYEIKSEGFDLYFEDLFAGMTDSQLSLLPDEIHQKISTGGALASCQTTRRLSFFQKLYSLLRGFKRRFIIIIEDPDKGMSIEDFFKMKKKLSNGEERQKEAESLMHSGTFVLGSRELIDAYHAQALLAASPAYKYLLISKNKHVTRMPKWFESTEYVFKFLANYEANRKRISMSTGISFSEWLVLIRLYDGKLIPSSSIYKEFYRWSFNSSAAKLKASFSILQQRGYVEKTGVSKAARIRITALGRDKVHEIANRFVLNV